MAWQTLDAERCPDCGLSHSETMAEGADEAYEVTALRCFACREKHRASEGFADRAGLYFTVKRTKEVDDVG